MSERKMYSVLEKYLEDAGYKVFDEKKLHGIEKVNNKKGTPDVMGFKIRNNDIDIHIFEGKTLSGREKFHQCIAQAKSLNRIADYLWVFFPEKEWLKLSNTDKEHNENELKENGIGLMLIGKNICHKVIEAEKNMKVEKNKKNVIIKKYLDEYEIIPQNNKLSYEHLATASNIVSYCYKIMKKANKIFKNYLKKNNKINIGVDDYDEGKKFVFSLYNKSGDIGFEGDPFSVYLKDGVPCIWFWLEFTKKIVKLEDIFDKKIKNSKFFTHILLDKVNDNSKMLFINEYESFNAIKQDYERFFKNGIWLGHKIEFLGRTIESNKNEIQHLLNETKTLF